jgi:NodT family efflux transporter outer membrane factor (OMF) lipoprotein
MFRVAPLMSLLSAVLMSGCAVGPDYRRPDIALTPAYIGGGAISSAPRDAHADWWSGFHDRELSRVVERALGQNLDIVKAAARVDQARAAAKFAGAGLLPRAQADVSAASVRQSIDSPIGAIAQAVGADRDYAVYSIGAEASWEIDAFGGLRRGREAARADARAEQMSEAAIRITVAAEAADAYLALRGLQARLTVARSQETLEARLVDLVERRAARGVSSERELHRVRGELERVRASMPPIQALIDAELNRLDVLMGSQAGTYRDELAAPAAQPAAPSPDGGSAPADLLRRRPDIVAAERRLAADNARIGAAVSEYYPHVSLSGLLGFASLQTGSLLTSAAAQGEGIVGLRWRLFDFGRVDAQVASAKGREAVSLAEYRAAVLRATEDVENALSSLANSDAEARALGRQIAELTQARDQTELAYENGVLSLIDVLDADRELLFASDRLAVVKSEQARAAVASYRALGGGWSG